MLKLENGLSTVDCGSGTLSMLACYTAIKKLIAAQQMNMSEAPAKSD